MYSPRKFRHKLLTSKEYKELYYNTPDWNIHGYNAILIDEESKKPKRKKSKLFLGS